MLLAGSSPSKGPSWRRWVEANDNQTILKRHGYKVPSSLRPSHLKRPRSKDTASTSHAHSFELARAKDCFSSLFVDGRPFSGYLSFPFYGTFKVARKGLPTLDIRLLAVVKVRWPTVKLRIEYGTGNDTIMLKECKPGRKHCTMVKLKGPLGPLKKKYL